jgi:hypothetical protein
MDRTFLRNMRRRYELAPRGPMEHGTVGDIARLVEYAEGLERRLAAAEDTIDDQANELYGAGCIIGELERRLSVVEDQVR